MISVSVLEIVLDQTLSTNKTDDDADDNDDEVNFCMLTVSVFCVSKHSFYIHVCVLQAISTHSHKLYEQRELTLQFTCANMHCVFCVRC